MIPVYEPLFLGNEKKYLSQAISQGEVSSGGRFVLRFEEAFAKWSGVKYAVAVSSGTSALETAIWSLEIDTINIPVGTIISCYIAAIRAIANVFFRDTGETKYLEQDVMRCHLFGTIDRADTSFKYVDDLSQYWEPFPITHAGCYSLYANKLITSGEGGILITNDYRTYSRAISYRNLCHTKERFVHNHLGYNFRMSNLQAAVALAQLEQIDKFIEIKQMNRDLYFRNLPGAAVPFFNVNVPWMYLITTKLDAGIAVKKLHKYGIDCRRYFFPLHKQPCIDNLGVYPRAEYLWKHAFYLPSGLTLTERQVIYVCRALRKILRSD